MAELGVLLQIVALMVGVIVAVSLLVLSGRVRSLRSERAASETALALLQRQIDAVRSEARREQETTLAAVRHEVTQFGSHVSEGFSQLRSAVTQELQHVTGEVNRRLQESMSLVQAAQGAMGQRLDQAATAVSAVHGQLGGLSEATRRIAEVGRDIAGLEQILRAPQVRGGLGEVLLERLLADVMPRASYRLQHGFDSGERVDAALVLGERVLSVDAKFPLENFRRMLAESDDSRRRQVRRAFLRDVRARVDEVAKKYILPHEGTFEFALMYVPAESVYYEVIVRDEDQGDEPVLGYALGRHVIPVSPNSFYAYLQIILLGLRGLRIEEGAREILASLSRLQTELERFREHFDTLGRHVANAMHKHDEAASVLARFEAKLETVERAGQGEGPSA